MKGNNMSNPLTTEEIKGFFHDTARNFMKKFSKAKQQRTWIMGMPLPSKNDVRKEFIADLTMISAMASLLGNTDVLGLADEQIKTQTALLEEEKDGFLEGAGGK